MEIEKKFLLKEKEKIYANKEFFPQIDALKKEIKTQGKRIIQSYLPLELLTEIEKNLNTKIKFEINEIRLRKIEDEYTITFKSKGKIKRSEYEKQINKEFYKKYILEQISSLEKYRLKKRIKNFLLDVDYYPKHSLITVEIEVKDKKDFKKTPKFGKDVSKEKEYSARHLAK